VFGNPLVLEMAQVAVEEAIRLGATFADVRYEVHQHEDLVVRNGRVHQAGVRSDRGLGVRALVNGAWGFAAVGQPSRHDAAVAARRAVELARAAAVLQDRPVRLAHEAPHCAVYRTPIDRDPLAVAIEDKMSVLMDIDRRLRARKTVRFAQSHFSAHRARKLYVSSEGGEIDQDLVYTGLGFEAGASDGHDFQLVSGPDSSGGLMLGRGWELVEGVDWGEAADRVGEEAEALLSAPPCPTGPTTLILGASAVAHQLRAAFSPATELDRGFAGETEGGGVAFLGPEHLGSADVASARVSISADATLAGGIGSYGFDDEGVEAQRVDLVSEGRLVGFQSGRETAERVGLERSSGAMRAAGWGAEPIVRPSNLSLAPGEAGTLEDLVADTRSGVLLETGRFGSIGGGARTFRTGCEHAWEIRDGRRTRRLKNPCFGAVTTAFWRACDAIGGPASWSLFGTAFSAKGAPSQILGVGAGAPPARFLDVELGSLEPPWRAEASTPSVSHPEAAALPKASASVTVPAALVAASAPTRTGPRRRKKSAPLVRKAGRPRVRRTKRGGRRGR
jgi:TldD protein